MRGATGAAAQVPPPPPPPAQAELALLLIDMSGSMLDPTPDGEMKFDVAIAAAHEFLDEEHTSREYALWTFTNRSATPIVTFEQHATRDQVRAELDALAMSVGGSTPFAGSFCDAVDYLIETQEERDANLPPSVPAILYEKHVKVFTDGLENSTPVHPCQGFRSTLDQPWTDVDSWQWKIYNKASTGSPLVPPDPTLPVTVIADVAMIFESFIPSATFAAQSSARVATPMAPSAAIDIDFGKAPALKDPQLRPKPDLISKVVTQDLLDDLAGTSRVASAVSTVALPKGAVIKTESVLALQAYRPVTLRTGGRFLSLTRVQDVPVTGDVNGDRCVSTPDYDAVMASYGRNVGYNAPADLNRDRTVNYSDYLTLLQNWGDGC